jgi:signal transduction histidine kinase
MAILERLVQINVHDEMSREDVRRMRAYNFLLLCSSPVMFSYGFHNVLRTDWLLGSFQLFLVPVLLSGPIIISRGFVELGKATLLLVILSLITFIHLIYGTHYTVYLFAYPAISALFTIHNIPAKWAIRFSILSMLYVTSILYISANWVVPRPYPINPMSGRYLEIFLSLLITALSFRWLRNEHDRIATSLERQHQITATRAQQLKMLIWALSHDLANPLSVILFSAEKGQKTANTLGSDTLATDLSRIARAATKQRELLTHIRKVAELAERAKELTLEPVDVALALHHARESVEDKLKNKQVTLNIILPTPGPLLVLAEPVGLASMVFANLLSNAIKFSHVGSTITISADRRRHGKKHLVDITLQDNGTGMDPEKAARLFENVINHSSKGTQGEEGTGFGIAIVQSHLQMYHATARVESAPVTSPVNGWHGTRVSITVAAAS